MPAKVDKNKCTGCTTCVDICPSAAIQIGDDDKAKVDKDTCVDCESCIDECPESAISME